MLEYPFDSAYIMRKKRAIEKELNLKGNLTKTKIAVLGGSTTNHIVDILKLFLLDFGINAQMYQCEYGQFYEEVLFHNEELKAFAPNYIFIHTTLRNIRSFPCMADSAEEVDRKLKEEYSRFCEVWDRCAQDYGCTVIQNNFELPNYRLMGNSDAVNIHGRVSFINRLNEMFCAYAREHRSFFINDINYLSAQCGLDSWNDDIAWHMYKYSPAPACIPQLCHSVAAIVKSVQGKNKKALVLDLDNTLWGGIVGDDGVEGIEIGNETPTGQMYREFQNYIKELSALGIMLTINSKNDYDNAIAGIGHPQSALSKEDFLVIKANWLPKDRNILEIAHELNIMPDSLVFVDDNPAEREIVSALGMGIATPAMITPESYIKTLDRNAFFEVTNFSEDDLHRNDMYKANSRREQLLQTAGSYEDYLRSLDMVATIKPFEKIYLSRIAQLTNKSNQFNLTTRRYTIGEIEQVTEDSSKVTLYGALADRFGDNGVVSVIIGDQTGDKLDIVLWLMSCRVLKRGMENAMLDSLVAQCRLRKIKTLRGHYFPTAKNGMVREFYAEMGFSKIEEDEQGNTDWELDLVTYHDRNEIIKTETEITT